MIASISKDKIPKQFSFVLKTEQLNTVLNENEITIHTDLLYCFSRKYGSFFEVFFLPPKGNITYKRLYIRTYALQKESVFLARKVLIETVFPEFILWVKAIQDLPTDSSYQGKQQLISASFIYNVLEINKEML